MILRQALCVPAEEEFEDWSDRFIETAAKVATMYEFDRITICLRLDGSNKKLTVREYLRHWLIKPVYQFICLKY